jgi:hypothetical protein
MNMKYLPFEDFEIHTTVTSDEVFHRLRAAVDTKRKWWIFTNKPFWGGEVERHYFRIWRVTWWSHNFTPIVTGKIHPEGFGSCLQIKLRMPWFGFWFYALILVWLWFIYFDGIANLIIQKIQTGIWQIESPWMLLPGIVMFAFAYLISVGTFMSEADKVKEYLLRISETKKENIKYQDRFFGVTEPQILKTLFLATLVASLGWIVYSLL